MSKFDLNAMEPAEREELLVGVFKWIRANGGMLPYDAYRERVRTWHAAFVDVAVVWVDATGRIHVLLEHRPETGHLYPGMYDVPGGNFTHRETAQEAAERIVSELGFAGEPEFAGVGTYVKTEAEIGVSLLFVLKVDQEATPEGCSFFTIGDMSRLADLVPWQRAIYPRMIWNFMTPTKRSTLEEYLGQ